MRRHENGQDNAVAERFFSYSSTNGSSLGSTQTGLEARSDVFDDSERFYNPSWRYAANDGPAPVEFEAQYFANQQSVEETRGDSVIRRPQN